MTTEREHSSVAPSSRELFMKLLGQAWTRPHHLEAILMACKALSVDNRPVTTTMTICPVYSNELQGVWVAPLSSVPPGLGVLGLTRNSKRVLVLTAVVKECDMMVGPMQAQPRGIRSDRSSTASSRAHAVQPRGPIPCRHAQLAGTTVYTCAHSAVGSA